MRSPRSLGPTDECRFLCERSCCISGSSDFLATAGADLTGNLLLKLNALRSARRREVIFHMTIILTRALSRQGLRSTLLILGAGRLAMLLFAPTILLEPLLQPTHAENPRRAWWRNAAWRPWLCHLQARQGESLPLCGRKNDGLTNDTDITELRICLIQKDL